MAFEFELPPAPTGNIRIGLTDADLDLAQRIDALG